MLIERSEANFTAAPVRFPAPADNSTLPTGEAALARGEIYMNLAVVLSKSIPLRTKAGDASVTEKAVADVACNVSPSNPSVLHAVNATSSAGSDEDKLLVVDWALTTSGVPAAAGTTALSALSKVPCMAKSVIGSCSTLLINQPSAVVMCDQTEKCNVPTEIDWSVVSRSGSR